MSRIIILAVLALHGAMAFGMKVLFFSLVQDSDFNSAELILIAILLRASVSARIP